jgi:hypothetical protein
MKSPRKYFMIIVSSSLFWGCAHQKSSNQSIKPILSIVWGDDTKTWPTVSDLEKIGLIDVNDNIPSGVVYARWIKCVKSDFGKIFVEFEIDPKILDKGAEPTEIDFVFNKNHGNAFSIKSNLASIYVDTSERDFGYNLKGTRNGWNLVRCEDLNYSSSAYRVEVLLSDDRKEIAAIKLIRGS